MEHPEKLPPRWLDSMRERRICLFHYRCQRSLTTTQAESVALQLIADNGKGRWDFRVVQLDSAGRDWEFRFAPRVARVLRFRSAGRG